jgi:hypothetical protein
MIKTFTQDDLIRFIYNECPETEKREISKALLCDTELLELYKQLTAVKQQVDRATFEPSDKTVQSILAYSKQP